MPPKHWEHLHNDDTVSHSRRRQSSAALFLELPILHSQGATMHLDHASVLVVIGRSMLACKTMPVM